MKSRITRILFTATLAAPFVFLTGCVTDRNYARISRNLTPELMTLSERPVDVHRHMHVAGNKQGRQFWEDLGRAWYTDHPSRLSPYPIVYTSGTPR